MISIDWYGSKKGICNPDWEFCICVSLNALYVTKDRNALAAHGHCFYEVLTICDDYQMHKWQDLGEKA